MKKYVHLVLAVIFVFALSGCSSYNYYTAAANKSNLTQYRTFAWAAQKSSKNKQWRPLDEIGNGKIQQAVKEALTQKGLALEQQNPDLLVRYAAVTGRGTKTEYYSPNYGYGGFGGWGFGYGYGFYRPWGFGWGWPGYYGGYGYAERVHYKEGTIVIDLIDTKSNTIVWRGYGVGELHNPKQTMKDIPKVVDGILKQLELTPPAKKS